MSLPIWSDDYLLLPRPIMWLCCAKVKRVGDQCATCGAIKRTHDDGDGSTK